MPDGETIGVSADIQVFKVLNKHCFVGSAWGDEVVFSCYPPPVNLITTAWKVKRIVAWSTVKCSDAKPLNCIISFI